MRLFSILFCPGVCRGLPYFTHSVCESGPHQARQNSSAHRAVYNGADRAGVRLFQCLLFLPLLQAAHRRNPGKMVAANAVKSLLAGNGFLPGNAKNKPPYGGLLQTALASYPSIPTLWCAGVKQPFALRKRFEYRCRILCKNLSGKIVP